MELVEVAATVSSPLVEVHFHTSAFDRYSFLQESSEAGDADVEINEENLKEVFDQAIMAGLQGRSIKEQRLAKKHKKELKRQENSNSCVGSCAIL